MRDLSRLHLTLSAVGILVVAIAGALYAFSEPDIPRIQLEAKYGTPPSQFLNFPDGTRMHYRVHGPEGAPTILLLHGFMGSLFVWEAWSRGLSDKFRVITVDLPGHGLTGAVPSNDYSQGAMAVFVKAFADRLQLGRFAVAGNSMGGDVAAHFAELYPERVSALILVDAAGAETNTHPRRNLIGIAASMPLLSDLVLVLPPCWFFPGAPHKPDAHSRCGSAPVWDFVRMTGSRRAMLAHFRLAQDSYVWAHVKNIKAPTLILWGRDDHTIPIASAYAWHTAIPGSKLITYPYCGHLPMLQAAKESAADVRAFLSR